ncbi:hypothetical protein E2C01_010828 [Portunus trituberculatus]|uniref:Uncharacterized protein n=1 Tax=Portunus trituberculatus TaxID=210409 RepID=A0A5B7D9N4_PORTR|nr:hypothetical protein [Portunus trituberculatus]
MWRAVRARRTGHHITSHRFFVTIIEAKEPNTTSHSDATNEQVSYMDHLALHHATSHHHHSHHPMCSKHHHTSSNKGEHNTMKSNSLNLNKRQAWGGSHARLEGRITRFLGPERGATRSNHGAREQRERGGGHGRKDGGAICETFAAWVQLGRRRRQRWRQWFSHSGGDRSPAASSTPTTTIVTTTTPLLPLTIRCRAQGVLVVVVLVTTTLKSLLRCPFPLPNTPGNSSQCTQLIALL